MSNRGKGYIVQSNGKVSALLLVGLLLLGVAIGYGSSYVGLAATPDGKTEIAAVRSSEIGQESNAVAESASASIADVRGELFAGSSQPGREAVLLLLLGSVLFCLAAGINIVVARLKV